MQMTERQIARNQEWRVVKITEVNPATNHFAAEDQYGTPMLLTLMGGIVQEIPAVGEQWYVSRQGSDWRLENRLELPDTQLPITSMNPGDVRIEASGTISVYGSGLNFNGSPAVTSVFGRTGAVVAVVGDYSLIKIGAGTNHALAVSGTTTMGSLATGTAGYLLKSGGSGADPSWVDPLTVATKPITAPTRQIFTTGSGTYTTPAGCTAIWVECIGGGGAGGGGVATSAGQVSTGGGGGGAAYAANLIASPAATYSYAVGAGGTGVSGAAGNNGGNTTFGSSLITAGGGLGGSSSAASATPVIVAGGLGGTPTGDLAIVGAPGTYGFGFSTAAGGVLSGLGGAGARGGGGGALYGTGGGVAGSNYGGGGSGAARPASAGAAPGGAGAVGLIVVTEFYSS